MKTLKTLDEIRRMAQAHNGKLFVRWSNGPAADARGGWRSRNHQSGAAEAGLSVNNVYADGSDAEIMTYLSEYRSISGERCWLCTGTEVGKGSDGEPVITDVQPLAYVADSLVNVSGTEIEIAKLTHQIAEDTARLERITDTIARRITAKRIERMQQQLAQLR